MICNPSDNPGDFRSEKQTALAVEKRTPELSRPRMLKCQFRSMQSKASNWVGAASIGLVTDDWMPLLGQMHSNLVLASCLKLHLG